MFLRRLSAGLVAPGRHDCSTGLANPGGEVFYADLTATAYSH